MKSIKARWAAKLLRSKHFVVLTDKESVICLRGVNPKSFSGTMELTAQMAELQDFSDKLKELIKEHKLAIAKLQKGTRATVNRKKQIKTTKVIKVKQG